MVDNTIDRLGKKDRKFVNKEIDAGARALGYDTEYGSPKQTVFNKDKFGICHDCVFLRGAESMYGRTIAICNEFEMRLNGMDPIKNCTEYKKRGGMTLWDMKEMALILDVDRRTAGFIVE